MKNKIIIVLTGHPSSGKGEVAQYLGKKYHAKLLKFSAVLCDELERLYLPATRKNFIKMSESLREHFGQDILAKVLAEDIKKSRSKIIIVDGARRLGDIKYLKNNNKFYLVGIIADPKIRYERQLKRREKPDDAKKTFKQFLREHRSASDKDVEKLLKKSDIKINNDGDLNDLHSQIDQIVKNL